MNNNVFGTSTVLVITPLNSLMKDQVAQIKKNFGISAATIVEGEDEDVLQGIEEGVYSIVYATPESFLAKKRCRTLASSDTFREDCVVVVVDGAHFLVQW